MNDAEILLKELIGLSRENNSLLKEVLKSQIINREILSLKDAAFYLGISTYTIHHYTSKGVISHYKPNNKNIYFRKDDLDAFMLQNRSEAIKVMEENILFKSIKL